jgi:hypothetical protein
VNASQPIHACQACQKSSVKKWTKVEHVLRGVIVTMTFFGGLFLHNNFLAGFFSSFFA